MSGYTQIELDDIQEKWGLKFPPDLYALYRERRKLIDLGDGLGSFDWLEAPEALIEDQLQWPLEGFLFDIRHGLWWPEWGERPLMPDAAEEHFRSVFARAPKLIPVFGHRYIPDEPHEAGNPVFSVWQMDVIHYGANLEDYVARETRNRAFEEEWRPLKKIAFWSSAVEYNDMRFKNGGGFAFLNRGNVLPE